MKIIVLIRDAFLFSSFDTKGDVGHQFVSVVHFSAAEPGKFFRSFPFLE
jgi:hypothetical protein